LALPAGGVASEHADTTRRKETRRAKVFPGLGSRDLHGMVRVLTLEAIPVPPGPLPDSVEKRRKVRRQVVEVEVGRAEP
jgi:hypothetical protein